jgi:hypothetical protein
LFLWIGETRIHWGVLAGRGRHAAWHEWKRIGIDGNEISSLYAALKTLPDELPAKDPGSPDLWIIIADVWLASASLPWSQALLDSESARRFACDYLQKQGFDVTFTDDIHLDDAAYGMPRLVVAYPEGLLRILAQYTSQWGAQWRSMRPCSVLAWNVLSHKHPGLQALMYDDRENVTLCLAFAQRHSGRARLLEIKRFSCPAERSRSDALKRIWERQCLRRPQGRDIGEIVVLDASGQGGKGDYPTPFVSPEEPFHELKTGKDWLDAYANTGIHALDHARLPRRTWRHWSVVFLLVLIVSGLVVEYGMQSRRISALRLAWREAQEAPHVARVEPTLSREESQRASAVNLAIRELNLPIRAVLEALRPPRDIRVAVLQVETSIAKSENEANLLKITAEAPSSSEMTRYVAYVSDRRPFVRAYLVRHEIVDQNDNFIARFRFMMEAEWRD